MMPMRGTRAPWAELSVVLIGFPCRWGSLQPFTWPYAGCCSSCSRKRRASASFHSRGGTCGCPQPSTTTSTRWPSSSLARLGGSCPQLTSIRPTEAIERYLQPLASHPVIAPRLCLRHRVVGASRLGRRHVASSDRSAAPLVVRVETRRGPTELLARAVIEVSGAVPNPPRRERPTSARRARPEPPDLRRHP